MGTVAVEITTGRASEGGHWYAQDGSPCYEMQGAKGLRAVTLRDARKFRLVPGVSSILQMEAKPQLERWKVRQALLAAVTLPRLAYESEDAFIERALEDSQEQARKAAARGTAIHAAIQGAFEGKPSASEDLPYVEPVKALLAQRYGLEGWQAETSFASPLGYGGKSDLINPAIPAVADIKCKDFGPEKQGKDLAWAEHAMQLAAYGKGFGWNLGAFDALNIFVSTRIPGLVRVREWDMDEIADNWYAFECLLRLWQIRKNYDPRFKAAA